MATTVTSESRTGPYSTNLSRSEDMDSLRKHHPPISPMSIRILSNSQNRSESSGYDLAQSPLEKMQLAYYRYEVTYGLYMMDMGEKVAINLVIASLTCLVLALLVLYLPPALTRLLKRLILYEALNGPSLERMNTTIEHLIADRVLSSPFPQVATLGNQTWSVFRR
ncbi:MAG: hypothetical protein M1831_004751 [Alyxoria varia]|nr:MAG: hypothetical protein M1831_004751 [Alyxoria varia]